MEMAMRYMLEEGGEDVRQDEEVRVMLSGWGGMGRLRVVVVSVSTITK